MTASAQPLAWDWLQEEKTGRAYLVKDCAYIDFGANVYALYREGPSLPFGIRTSFRPQGTVTIGTKGIRVGQQMFAWTVRPEQVRVCSAFDAAAIAADAKEVLPPSMFAFVREIGGLLAEGNERMVRSLIGRGKGLTPSGDDALVGALYAARKLGLRTTLGEEVIGQLDKTNTVSATFLYAAARGYAFEAIEEVFGERRMQSMRALCGYGAESGKDILSGILAFILYYSEGKIYGE